jgi:hypothetical protein
LIVPVMLKISWFISEDALVVRDDTRVVHHPSKPFREDCYAEHGFLPHSPSRGRLIEFFILWIRTPHDFEAIMLRPRAMLERTEYDSHTLEMLAHVFDEWFERVCEFHKVITRASTVVIHDGVSHGDLFHDFQDEKRFPGPVANPLAFSEDVHIFLDERIFENVIMSECVNIIRVDTLFDGGLCHLFLTLDTISCGEGDEMNHILIK